MPHAFKSETDLGAAVVAHFKKRGGRVGAEVCIPGFDELGRPDCVVEINGEIWIICLKLALGVSVLAQCWKLVPYAHRVYACVPAWENPPPSWKYVEHVMQRDNVGLLLVDGKRVFEELRPRGMSEPKAAGIEVTEAHTKYAPGNAENRYHTKNSELHDELVRLVTEEPWHRKLSRFVKLVTSDPRKQQELKRWAEGSALFSLESIGSGQKVIRLKSAANAAA